MLTTQEAAAHYAGKGLRVVPIPAGKKGPELRNWQDLRITPETVPQHFNGRPQNVGIILGKASGWLVDVDLDVPEAVKIAGTFLSPTLTSGRSSTPHSHWWYVAPAVESLSFKDASGTVLVELRSTGRQTVVAPSVHPSGEHYVWYDTCPEPLEVTADVLTLQVRQLATAALLARHVPSEGGCHTFALCVAGYLLRSGRLDGQTTLKIMLAAWSAAEADSREAIRDIEAIVRDTAEKLAEGEPVVGGPTLEEIAPGVPRLLAKWWGWPEHSEAGDPHRGPTQAELLLRHAQSAELFHAPEGVAYATMRVGDYRETWPVRSKTFKLWLLRQYYAAHDTAPNAQALSDARSTIEARALFDGAERQVYVRVAGHGGKVYLDLCNDRWEAVEITPGGWRVIPSDTLPVRFIRKDNAASLPYPVPGGSIEDLRPLLNVRTEEDWRLTVGWLVGALNPDGPYPVLVLQGEQGSAKSTTVRVLRSVVDPAVEPLRAPPRDARDLAIAASGNWTPAFDNLSGIKPWLSDGLCRLATGGGFATRELYSDDREILFSSKRPVILNGIDSLATAGDLRDRSVVIELPHIPPHKRRTEREFSRDLEARRPKVLGALLDAVSAALRNRDTTELDGLPRMGDFALWVVAAEEALGWQSGAFMKAYSGNRHEADELALDNDLVAVAVRSLMKDRNEWTGSSTRLLEELGRQVNEDVKRSRAWPGTPQTLSNRMKRLAPTLRRAGIEYGEGRVGHQRTRLKTLRRTRPERDRPHRPQDENSPLQGVKSADDQADSRGRSADSGPCLNRPRETLVNAGLHDDADDADDDKQGASEASKKSLEDLTVDAVTAGLDRFSSGQALSPKLHDDKSIGEHRQEGIRK